MPGETPDWGALSAQDTVFPVTDLGELAARLGAITTHDRRGDVIWWDNFECGIEKWVQSTGGTGASIALSTARARNGRYSCLLTGGSNALLRAIILHAAPFLTLSRFGLELSFHLPGTIDNIIFQIQVFDGTNRQQAEIRWTDATNQLAYFDSAGAYTDFGSAVDLSPINRVFHTAKLVVDPTLQAYHRFILDDTEHNLSANAVRRVADGAAPRLEIGAFLFSRAGQNDQAYLDDVIITQNEPA